jgi:PAS domain S-box-containing protein
MREEIEPPHKKSETLPKSGEICKALLASSGDAILGVDRKGKILFWNKGAEQVFGYSSGEILGQSATKLISERLREDHTLVLRAFLNGNRGKTGRIESEALRKDGSTFPLELSLSIQQENGKFCGLAVARNITELQHIEQALKESAKQYCSLFENCLEAVFSANMQDGSGEQNTALEKLGRYCLQELTELKPANAIPPEGRELLSRQVDKLLSADEPVSSIVRRILRKDGRRILVEQYLDLVNRKARSAGSQGLHTGMAVRDRAEERLSSSFVDLARIVSRVVESCDPYTAGHQQRVAELASLVGDNMGLADDIINRLYLDGLLHDIGKISIPRSILTKPGELAEEEWSLIRSHTRQGYSILKDANLPWSIADVALQHHERLDGSGYPDGVTEEGLSLEIGILAVCDVVEAMSSHRPYRPARTTADVLQELRDGRATKYNASVVDVMMPMIESGEFRSTWNGRNSKITAT